MNDTVYYIFDITNSAAWDYFYELYRRLTLDWDYIYHKLVMMKKRKYILHRENLEYVRMSLLCVNTIIEKSSLRLNWGIQ